MYFAVMVQKIENWTLPFCEAIDLGRASGGNLPLGTTGKQYCQHVWKALLEAMEELGEDGWAEVGLRRRARGGRVCRKRGCKKTCFGKGKADWITCEDYYCVLSAGKQPLGLPSRMISYITRNFHSVFSLSTHPAESFPVIPEHWSTM